ncbi:hypothetical protein HK103_006615 [Boothiomyces macroporosus]|uniref:Secreted protein n=1 Tax=Boothiomyces macroporosus TaxID=261099 RepID=A0AAD5UGS9_9FUNG|nr:hypothetical protein HK103_006615 [Boothiomyces macroporosus]
MKSFAALALASSAFSQIIVNPNPSTGPDPSQVHISDVVYNGSGCPSGSVVPVLSEDAQTFTLLFSNLVASTGPGTTITDTRKNCQINFNVHFPGGFSYSVGSVEYRGYVSVPAGITATQKATYYFSGQSQQVSSQVVFNKPTDQDYHAIDTFDVGALVWSPCGTTVGANINTQVRVTYNPNQAALMTIDSADGHVAQVYSFNWKTC